MTTPSTQFSRKRKLVFEHIPTQQSSMKERIQYWEKEGSLRKAGDPGLPGSSSTKVSKTEPGVIYCDTPPTDEEEWSESAELYGAPKLLKMSETKFDKNMSKDPSNANEVKPRMTVDRRYSSNYQEDENSPDVIEIQDEEAGERLRTPERSARCQ